MHHSQSSAERYGVAESEIGQASLLVYRPSKVECMQKMFVGRLAMDEIESSKTGICTFCSDVLEPTTQKSRPRGPFLVGQMNSSYPKLSNSNYSIPLRGMV